MEVSCLLPTVLTEARAAHAPGDACAFCAAGQRESKKGETCSPADKGHSAGTCSNVTTGLPGLVTAGGCTAYSSTDDYADRQTECASGTYADVTGLEQCKTCRGGLAQPPVSR